MLIEFYKYHGAGNDFIIINNLDGKIIELPTNTIKHICDRHFGIGADGLMILNSSKEDDFNMYYYNCDGYESTMCGNGGRCIVSFAHKLGLIQENTKFRAIDGIHKAIIKENEMVSLKMSDVCKIEKHGSDFILDTGSPHLVRYVKNLIEYPVIEEAKKIRFSERYADTGVNINFVEIIDNTIHIRTYERGVEDETLACGTGAVAAAISSNFSISISRNILIKAIGGDLFVDFFPDKNNCFTNIWLTGPVKFVYKGFIEI